MEDRDNQRREVRITESYKDYVPPFNVTGAIRRVLRTIPDKYLVGIDSVVLTNEAALPRKDRKGKVWSRKHKLSKSLIAGRYHPGVSGSSSWIELRVDKILSSGGSFYSRIPFFRNLIFSYVLGHEIGHHIHRTMRPERKEREDVADEWAGKLSANFLRKHYWYAIPVLSPAFKVYRFARHKGLI